MKTFNNINFVHLAELHRPSGSADRSALIIAGDDAAARATVAGLLDAIGYDALDAGPLAAGRRYGPDTPAYGIPYFDPAADASIADPVNEIMPPSSTTTAADLQRALDAFAG